MSQAWWPVMMQDHPDAVRERERRKNPPKRPAPGECHCAYETHSLEMNTDFLDRNASNYQLIVKTCPVHGGNP